MELSLTYLIIKIYINRTIVIGIGGPKKKIKFLAVDCVLGFINKRCHPYSEKAVIVYDKPSLIFNRKENCKN